MLFVIDVSHHQDLSLDLAQCKTDGISAVLLKAGEGSSFVDPEFAANLAEALAAGLLAGAYWYVRGTATAAQHIAKIRQVVPAGMAVIPDVELGSGGVGLLRQIVDGLLAAGYLVPWTYLPRWYWQQIESPSLAGLPPLWSSRYPDNVVGLLADEWAMVPASYWAGYGGLEVGLLQFTSSARIAGYAPLDASAYPGTRAQLAALLGGGQEDDMPTAKEVVDELLGRVVPFHADPANVGGPLWMHISGANWSAQRSEQILTEQRAILAALLAGQQDDVTDVDVLERLEEAMGVEIDRLRAELVAAREADRVAMVAAVRDTVPADLADQVVTRIGERLAPVAPVSGGGA